MTSFMAMTLGKCTKCQATVRLAQKSISTVVDGKALIEHVDCPKDLPPLRPKRTNSY